ncbi:MAG TPA: BTAD domain-containing putative transcriptional regulator [Candidatus Limnocylindrales bacterium]
MAADLDQCRFRILGPVQVMTAGGPVVFRRRQQVDLLALLLLNAGRMLSIGQIVDAMWGESAPRTASAQIKNMVSEIRRSLVDGPRPLAALDWQLTGYRLRIVDGVLDLTAFTRLRAEARAAAQPDAVVRTLRRALGLWQGDALSGVRADFADTARAHLQELRLSALEDMFDAELECANHLGIVAELADAVARNPGRERLAGQLMIALHRGGRTTGALAVYRRIRQTLADEFAVEPGAALRELERSILLGDKALDRVPDPAPTAGAASPTPAQLPPDINGFVGRNDELAKLDKLVSGGRRQPETVVIPALTGTAGIGKTALAVHWAHRVADSFPDGQLYVNLRGFDPDGSVMSPAEAVRGFLDALGIPPERIPSGLHAQAALYRSLVVERRMLVVLDNAANSEHVRPLLPGGSGCLVLVTSRSQLVGLVASEGAIPITLDLLTGGEARDLLAVRLGAERIAAEERAAAEIAAHCARLPLALAVVAARATVNPRFPLASLSGELSRARGTLGALAGPDATSDVRTVFSWSYGRLGAAAARLFRLIGLHPGPDVSTPAAASLMGLPIARARPHLAELADAHLVAEHVPGRYLMHDLLRAYAAELAHAVDPETERRDAITRVLDHYLHSANAAALMLNPHRHRVRLIPAGAEVAIQTFADLDRALDWFKAEHQVLVAAVEHAAAGGWSTHAWQVSMTLTNYLDRHCHWHDWVGIYRATLAAAERLEDRVALAHTHIGLCIAHSRLHEYDLAHHHLRQALGFTGELDNLDQAYAHNCACIVHLACDEYADALHHAEQAVALYRAEGHWAGVAQAVNNVGWCRTELGDFHDAIACCEEAVALHRQVDDQLGYAHALDSLGFAHHRLGNHEQAAALFGRSATLMHEAQQPYYEAFALNHLGDTYRAWGKADPARDAWREALRILDAHHHPDAEQVAAKLRRVGREPGHPPHPFG